MITIIIVIIIINVMILIVVILLIRIIILTLMTITITIALVWLVRGAMPLSQFREELWTNICVYIYIYIYICMYVCMYLSLKLLCIPSFVLLHQPVQSYRSKGIWRQGIGSFDRNSCDSTRCPVVICPYLCTSDQCLHLRRMRAFWSGTDSPSGRMRSLSSQAYMHVCIYIYI